VNRAPDVISVTQLTVSKHRRKRRALAPTSVSRRGRVQVFGQATSQVCQWTGINDVRHRLWLSTGTQSACCHLFWQHHNDPAQCRSDSGETIVVSRSENPWLSDCDKDKMVRSRVS